MIEQRRRRPAFPGRLTKPVKTGKTNSQTNSRTVFYFLPFQNRRIRCSSHSSHAGHWRNPFVLRSEPYFASLSLLVLTSLSSRGVGQSLTLHYDEILRTGQGQDTTGYVETKKYALKIGSHP